MKIEAKDEKFLMVNVLEALAWCFCLAAGLDTLRAIAGIVTIANGFAYMFPIFGDSVGCVNAKKGDDE